MKFEQIIKKISAMVAGIIVFLLAGGFYLQLKGFEPDQEKGFVLAKAANAAETDKSAKTIPMNYAFPDDHVLGKASASVTLYEYSSFGCFHCADFHLLVLPELQKEFVDKGLLKVVFVPLPLDKGSMDAALLAECVGKDKYFDFVDLLFKKQRDWGMAFNPQKVLLQYAALSGVGDEKAKACLKDDAMAERILKDRQAGLSDLKISGTPSFVVSSKSGNQLVEGFKNFDEFSKIIKSHLGQ